MPTSHLHALVHTLRHEADGVLGIELQPAGDTAAFPAAEPGAHIDLHLPNGMVRSYSLCNPGETHRYVLGVLNDRASRGGSRFIHEQLRVGTRIDISAPRNHFALEDDARKSILVAGGIGITPLFAMLQRLRAQGRAVHMVYCARSRREAAFLAPLAALMAGTDGLTLHFDDERGGPPDLAALLAPHVDAAPHFYACGPGPMLAAFEAACASLGQADVHVERFAAAAPVAAASGGAYVVELRKSGRIVTVREGQPLLDAVLDAGCDAPYSCREGICGACETTVLEGEVEHRDGLLSPAEQQAGKTMMICVSRARAGSATLVLDL